ncbi:hypothetical protein jhhlp_003732 [Lomentospora prolificans]|uniref:ACB domain-containing protein n=1 Tax=Lomentospora prolificans TaxID=41688 RepID=A0A2N3N9J5_9PEZI|nr:hypothetical protein jhhlp_003732 [Lomentospora prolificans]
MDDIETLEAVTAQSKEGQCNELIGNGLFLSISVTLQLFSLRRLSHSSNLSTMASNAAFQKAAEESKQLTSKPSNDELLELYALYKVGNGEDISKAPSPGMFDLKGKAKKAAWQKIVDEGITAEQAQERYIALVNKLKETYGFDANKAPEAVGS